MGRTLVRVIAETEGIELSAAVERAGHPDLGRDAGELAGTGTAGVTLAGDPAAAAAAAGVWIDFTTPESAARAAEVCAARRVAMVVGTTGLGEPHRAALAQAARAAPVVVSSNMSVGVNVLVGLLEKAAQALGPGFDLEIVEWHHRQKKDAPSGTALMMAEALAQATGRNAKSDALYGRQGQIGARTDREIGVLAVRGGDVVGDHTAYFLGLGERLELTHRASSRDTFARGAVRAALWTRGRPAGLYDMRDVLGLG